MAILDLNINIPILENTICMSLLSTISELLVNLVINIKNRWDIGIILIGIIIFIYGWIKFGNYDENTDKTNVKMTTIYYITLIVITITGILKYMEHTKQINSTMYSAGTHIKTILWTALALFFIDLKLYIGLFNTTNDNNISLIILLIICIAIAPPVTENRNAAMNYLKTLPYFLLMNVAQNNYITAEKEAHKIQQKLQTPQIEHETQEQINNRYNEAVLNTKLNVEKVNKISLLDNNAS